MASHIALTLRHTVLPFASQPLSVSFCQTILACKAELLCMQITAHVSGDLRTLAMAMVLLWIASLRAMIDLVLGMLWPVS